MIKLNLLPDVKKEFLHAQRVRRRAITMALLATGGALAGVVLLAVYVYGAQALMRSTLTSDVDKRYSELKEFKDLGKYMTIQQQLSSLSELHDSKRDFSRLLEFLPTLNPAPPQNAQLSSLEVDDSGQTIVIKGVIADFLALNTFKDTLTNAELSYKQDDKETTEKLFEGVIIDAAAFSSNENNMVVFTMTLSYNEKAFTNSVQSVRVSVPSKETTQSVVQTPQSVFDDEDGGDKDGV